MYLVVFRNRKRDDIAESDYAEEGMRMWELAQQQPGFLSFKDYVSEDGEEIALSEWVDEESARAWGRQAEHLVAQGRGRTHYYASYTLFTCNNPRVHRFGEDAE